MEWVIKDHHSELPTVKKKKSRWISVADLTILGCMEPPGGEGGTWPPWPPLIPTPMIASNCCKIYLFELSGIEEQLWTGCLVSISDFCWERPVDCCRHDGFHQEYITEKEESVKHATALCWMMCGTSHTWNANYPMTFIKVLLYVHVCNRHQASIQQLLAFRACDTSHTFQRMI